MKQTKQNKTKQNKTKQNKKKATRQRCESREAIWESMREPEAMRERRKKEGEELGRERPGEWKGASRRRREKTKAPI